ncbi:MAG: alpha/beta hydrolase family protein [Pirellulales bacterium]
MAASDRLQRNLSPHAASVILLTACAWSAAISRADAADPLAGPWQGKLNLGAVELRLVFHLAADDKGRLTATMDSPDQGAKGLPIESATREGKQLKLEAKTIRGAFEGTVSDDGLKISGHWKQSGQSLPLELTRLEKEPDYRRPQEPRPPFPYRVEQVTYRNAQADVQLAGTLTLPEAKHPVPAVLLLSGSGAQDRDETILGHKPFSVLADYLTRRGVAVLRMDDRGVGGSTGSTDQSTTADLVDDALAGVEYLQSRREIDPRHIGLLGHSEGAMIAPLSATRTADVAFVIMLAGTGVNGEKIILQQGELIARAQKADETRIAAGNDLQRQVFDIVKNEPDAAKAEERIRAAMLRSEAYISAPSAEAKKAVEEQMAVQAKTVLTPWFRFFLTYDPAPALRKVRCPVLVLNGEKDLQVDPKQNLPPIAAALKESGNRDVTIRELPGLNHLFQHCRTGSPVEYGKIDETLAPEVLELVGDWIVARAK